MPGKEKQVMEYYEKNPSAMASLRGSLYEEKIIDLMKQKSKQTKKTISLDEAEELIKKKSEKPKKTVKSSQKNKKIRKK